ncbi:MAG: glycosyltransferase family 4 protein, partial [Gemmatimonadales bacterium]|nr:glycosyltransferase family 4 protein [Gemmatimonadales bacterium]
DVDGVRVVRLPMGRRRGSRARYLVEYSAFLLLAFVTVWRLARRCRYAIAHVHTLPDFLVFAAAPARWYGAKLLLDLHEITPEFYQQKYGVPDSHRVVRLLQRVEQASIRYADAAITVNEPLRERFVARGTPPTKVSVVMNAADEQIFPPGSSAYVNGGEPPDRFALVYHGSLLPIYGLELAVRAIAAVRTRWPYRLVLYGSGEGEAQIVATARSLGFEDRLEMRGPVAHERIAGILKAAGGGIVPTLPGPMLDLSLSNKLLEMAWTGLPVIAAGLPSYRRYFDDDSMLFFQPGDRESLADALRRFASLTDSERGALGRRAAEAAARISWSEEVKKYLRLVNATAAETGNV